MKHFLLSFSVGVSLLTAVSVQAQNLTAQNLNQLNYSAQQLVQQLVGTGVTVSNVTISGGGSRNCMGLFQANGAAGPNFVGFQQGVMLATGTIGQTPLTESGNNQGGASVNGSNLSDANLETEIGANSGDTKDAVFLEFDFIPLSDTIRVSYCFASEEYNEYVCSGFNDAFAFLISGPGIAGLKNIALVPNTTQRVAINTINNGSCGSASLATTCNGTNQPCNLGNTAYYKGTPNNGPMQFDGHTIKMEAKRKVQPCQTYHIKLVIADLSDRAYDSAVFLEAQSFTTGVLDVAVNGNSGNNNMSEGCDPATITFTLEDPAPAGGYTVPITFGGTATQGTDYTYTPSPIKIPAGQTSVTVTINPLTDAVNDAGETVTMNVQTSVCGTEQFIVTIREPLAAPNVTCSTTSNSIIFSWNNVNGATSYQVSNTSANGPWGNPNGTNQHTISGLPNGACRTLWVRAVGGYCSTNPSGTTSCCINNCTLTTTATGVSPLCNGASNGTATANPSGGSAAYTYSWSTSPTSTGQTASGLAAGVYTVTVTSGGCSATATVSLTNPPVLNASITTTQTINCFNGTNGAISVTASGGTTPYTYSIDNGANQSGNTFSGLGSGNHTVTVTDSKGCTKTASVNLANPADLTASASVTTQPTCSVGGTVSVTAGGGTSPYTYSWSSGATTATASGLNPGGYTVTVTDSKGCTETASVTLATPGGISASASLVNGVSCFGGSDGQVSVSVSGGTTPYTYTPSGGSAQSSNVFTGLSAGTFTVTVQDVNGCSVTTSVTVTQPSQLNASITTTQTINCFNGTNGAISVTASGGTTPYTYSIDNGANQSGNTFSGLGSGNHTVTVTDSKGCTKTASVNLANPADLTASASVTTQPTCSVGGTVSVTAGGGTSPYTYSWSSGATTATASGLNPGGYTVTVTDSKGCTETASVTLAAPGGISASASLVNGVSCFGGNDGQVSVSVSGGTTPYTYTPSGGSAQSSNVFTGLSAGTFTVTVQDVNGCSVTTSVTITQPSQLNASITTTQTINCFNGTNGAISVTASGGTTPYTYSIDNGANQSGNTFSGLGSGNHTVTVTDSKGCTKTASVNLANPADLTASASVTTQPTCSVGGTVSVTAGGGTSPYTYSWSSGATTATASGLNPGGYTVTVTDSKGCTETASVTLAVPGGISASTSLVNGVSCFGGSDGQVSVSVSGGTTPYTYTPSGGSAQSSNVFTGLSAGTFTVTVQDVNGCSVTTSVTITQPSQLNVSLSSTAISCGGDNSGQIVVTATGGTQPYTYSIGGTEQSSPIFPNLFAGNYYVTVKDANGCLINRNLLINQPAPLTININSINPKCNALNDGSIIIAVTGGVPPYSFSMNGSTPQLINFFDNLSAGTYNLTVSDANGCSITASTTLTEPTPLTLSLTGTNISCNGGTDGTVSTVSGGGTGAYTYTWSNAQTTANLTNVAAGTYDLTVSDANGCSITASTTLTEPTPLTLSLTGTNISCNGGTDGTVSTVSGGGTGAYTYTWSNAQTTANLTNVAAGTYDLTVSDANGCSITASTTLTEPTPLTLSLTGTNISCNGGTDGTVSTVSGGGTGAYTYTWSNAQTTANLTNVAAGTYDLTVSDANGCSITASTTLTEPTPLTLSLTGTNISCNGGTDGTVSTVSGGGTGAYTYTWSNAQTTANLTNVAAGTYDLTVSDANGCSITASTTLTEPTPLTLSLTGTNISCNGGTDGTVSTVSGGGTGAYTYTWSNAQTTANLTNVAAGTYDLTVSDANGCSITASTTLIEPTPLTLSLTGTNISCNGGTDGTVSTVSGGGTGAYTYTWSNAQTTANLTNVAAGTYDLTVSDANGCSITASTTLTEPTPLTLSLTGTNISCNGGTDGTVSTVSGGGTGAYTYTWSNAQTSANLTNVTAGTYDLTVSDANGCSITASTTLTEPTPLTLSLTGTNISCNGGTDGTVSTVSGGGTGAYTYTWSNAQTTANLTNVAAGTYDLTVSDANGCSITASTTLTEPTPLTLSLTGTNISCNGGTDGTVSTVSGGGTGAYTYTWSNAQTSANLTNVTAGTYDLTVSDANGCSITASTTLTEPTPLTLSLTGTNISCNGGTDGTVSTVSGGGTGAYTYTWSNAQTSANLTNVTAGTYDLTVSDANGCSITASTTLTEPTPLTLSLTGTNISCNGGTDGTVSTVSGGGTGAYTYTWSNAQTTANLTNVAAGTYDLTVSDANGCSITASTTLTEPTPLTLSLTGTNISCNGGTDGTVSTVSGGGTGAYTYTWSNAQTSANLTNVTAGTYDLTVSDANGCSITASTTLTEPTPLTLSLTGTNISCNGGTDGTVSTVSGGGTGAYTYTWSNAQTTANLTNVAAGTYDLTVSDANGCSITASTTLTEPTPLTLSLTGTNISCNGGTDGTVSTVSGGGTGAYTYTWSNAQTTANLTNVAAGTYDLTVSDANGCSITASTTLTEPTPLTLSLTGTNISCNGGTDGTVSTVSGGGTGAYTYTWSNAQTSANLTNVTAGTYDLTVSDANGCSITASTTLTEPTPLTLSLTGTNISCNGGTDGTVSTVSGGGTGAYTYTWSNAQTTANLTNVAAGTYDLTVSDANGCSITASTTLTEPTPLTLSLTGTNISCNGGTDGTVSTVSGGGTGAYTYTWSNAQTSANLTNVTAGTYDLTVSDANGCSITASTTLTEPTPLTLSLTGTNISCNGGTDGTVSTVSGGGTGAYTYTWSNAQTTANLTNVAAGTYDLTVSDANGCSITASTTLTEPTPLTLSLTGTNISCNGGTDGTVSTVSGGGTGAYTYTWSNAQTSANLTNVTAGTYDLTVSDANGCSITASTTLTEPTPLTLSLTGTNISCNGGTDGTVSTVSGGGTGAYTYTWSNAQTTANLTNVAAGTYDLTVSDANGCSITASTTLTEPTPLTLSLTGTNISCNGGTDGTVSTVSGGGTGAYTYTWSNAQTTANLTNVAAGTYDLTVSDANGCSITASTTLTEPTPLTLSLTGTNISCNGGTDGTVSTVSGGGTGAYTYTWSNAQTTANLTNVAAGTYDLTVSDANGCSITASTTLTEPTPLTLSLTGTNISCNGGTDGTVSTVSGGGTGAYTYTWSNAQTTANLTNVAAGTYDLTVSDANGCSITASTTLIEPTPLTLSLTGTNISCNGGTDGTVSTVSGGGTGAYTYTWSNAQTSANLTNVTAGTYDLTVSDANGCSITASTTLTEPTPLTLSLTGTNISCNGGTDGTVSTVSGGGTGAYTYTWSNAQTSANLTNVTAGTYDLTVSDANGCSITASTTLTEPTPLTLSLTGTNISCNGGTDGTVSTVSGGGTGAYTYTWSNAQTSANLTNVTAGTYDLTVSDANGCSITASTTLTEPTPLTLSLTGYQHIVQRRY
jgi:hypothetical protein